MPLKDLNCIGRSRPLPWGNLRLMIEDIRRDPCFSRERAPMDVLYPISQWLVDELPVMACYEPMGFNVEIETANLRRHAAGKPLEDYLCDIKSVELSMVRSRTTAHAESADIPLTLLLRAASDDHAPKRYDLVIERSDRRMPHNLEETRAFLQRTLGAVGALHLIEIADGANGPEYRLSGFDFPGGKIFQIDQCREKRGNASPALVLSTDSLAKLVTLKSAVLETWLAGDCICEDVLVRLTDFEAWLKAREWFTSRTGPPWSVSCVDVRAKEWSEALMDEMNERRSEFPIGTLQFSRKCPHRELRELSISVDAFPEGSGWSIAFHLFEESVGKSRRDKIRTVLNGHFGSDLIVRTPETMWPSVFR